MRFRHILLTTASAVCFSFAAFAQNAQTAAAEAAKAISDAPETKAPVEKPQYWTQSLMTNVNFGQTSFSNWAAGGDNTSTLAAYIDGNANYKKTLKVKGKDKEIYWKNRLQLDYGFLYSSSKPIIQKNTDRIYLESKWGYEIEKRLFFSANYDFKSQFTRGYTYATPSADIIAKYGNVSGIEELSKSDQKKAWNDARVPKSAFLAPAYTNIAIGFDWKPKEWFSVGIAPATGGFVIVTDPGFRKSYSMGLKKKYSDIATDDPLYLSGEAFKGARFELGAQVKVDLKLTVNDNLKYTTQLVLFSNYLDKPQNVRVNWDNRFDWKLSKLFTATLITNLIYDDKIYIGNKRAGLQFKESFALGFSYTFASKKK